MKKAIIALTTTAALTSCGAEGDSIGRYESPLWHMTASEEEKLEYFKNQCMGFGFKAGTPELAQCVQNQSNQSSRSANDRFSRAMENMQGPKTTRTNCSTFGSSINCTSSTW